jgi:hypothetical protein
LGQQRSAHCRQQADETTTTSRRCYILIGFSLLIDLPHALSEHRSLGLTVLVCFSRRAVLFVLTFPLPPPVVAMADDGESLTSTLPSSLRQLRACLSCHLILTTKQWDNTHYGCPNCQWDGGFKEMTTPVFKGSEREHGCSAQHRTSCIHRSPRVSALLFPSSLLQHDGDDAAEGKLGGAVAQARSAAEGDRQPA